jgi:hypothetical protein
MLQRSQQAEALHLRSLTAAPLRASAHSLGQLPFHLLLLLAATKTNTER